MKVDMPFKAKKSLRTLMLESVRERRLWVCPYFSSSVFLVLEDLCDGRQVVVQLLFWRALQSGFIQNSTRHSCIVPIYLLQNEFSFFFFYRYHFCGSQSKRLLTWKKYVIEYQYAEDNSPIKIHWYLFNVYGVKQRIWTQLGGGF